MDLEQLKYPIGRYKRQENLNTDHIKSFISEIAELPLNLRKEVQNLNETQLNTEYRPGGWTIRQVIHHLSDSHMNSLIRFKLALTEDKPTVKPYVEGLWAELPDSKFMSVEAPLKMIEGIHERWVFLMENLKEKDWEKTFYHPESQKYNRLDDTLCLYAWHGKHHLAHIVQAKKYINL